MYACGLRISEASTLEISAIYRPNQVLRIVGGMTGSGHFCCSKARNLPRTNLARALMGTRKFGLVPRLNRASLIQNT
jgi:site-specific recombinase XerD